MPGVCPNCVKLVSEGEACPTCGGRLVPVSQWANERERLLPPPAERPAGRPTKSPAGYPTEQPTVVDTEAPRAYGLRFFLGCVTGVAAAIAMVVIVFAIKGS
jgi:hypothetical protein